MKSNTVHWLAASQLAVAFAAAGSVTYSPTPVKSIVASVALLSTADSDHLSFGSGALSGLDKFAINRRNVDYNNNNNNNNANANANSNCRSNCAHDTTFDARIRARRLVSGSKVEASSRSSRNLEPRGQSNLATNSSELIGIPTTTSNSTNKRKYLGRSSKASSNEHSSSQLDDNGISNSRPSEADRLLASIPSAQETSSLASGHNSFSSESELDNETTKISERLDYSTLANEIGPGQRLVPSFNAAPNPLTKNKKPVRAPISQESVNSLLELLLLFFISTFGCMGSVLVMSALTVIESLQTRGNCYVVSQSMAQLLVTIFVLPSSAIQLMAGNRVIDEYRLCHYQWLTMQFSLIVNQLSFMLMAADNYLGYKCSEKVITTLPSQDPASLNNVGPNQPDNKHDKSSPLAQEICVNQDKQQQGSSLINGPNEKAGSMNSSTNLGEKWNKLPLLSRVTSAGSSGHQSVIISAGPKSASKPENPQQSNSIFRPQLIGAKTTVNINRVQAHKSPTQKQPSLAAQFLLNQREKNIDAQLTRAGLLSYRVCCGRLRVLIWILSIWMLAFACTLHEHELSFGHDFCVRQQAGQSMQNAHQNRPKAAPNSLTESKKSPNTSSSSGGSSINLTSGNHRATRSARGQASESIIGINLEIDTNWPPSGQISALEGLKLDAVMMDLEDIEIHQRDNSPANASHHIDRSRKYTTTKNMDSQFPTKARLASQQRISLAQEGFGARVSDRMATKDERKSGIGWKLASEFDIDDTERKSLPSSQLHLRSKQALPSTSVFDPISVESGSVSDASLSLGTLILGSSSISSRSRAEPTNEPRRTPFRSLDVESSLALGDANGSKIQEANRDSGELEASDAIEWPTIEPTKSIDDQIRRLVYEYSTDRLTLGRQFLEPLDLAARSFQGFTDFLDNKEKIENNSSPSGPKLNSLPSANRTTDARKIRIRSKLDVTGMGTIIGPHSEGSTRIGASGYDIRKPDFDRPEMAQMSKPKGANRKYNSYMNLDNKGRRADMNEYADSDPLAKQSVSSSSNRDSYHRNVPATLELARLVRGQNESSAHSARHHSRHVRRANSQENEHKNASICKRSNCDEYEANNGNENRRANSDKESKQLGALSNLKPFNGYKQIENSSVLKVDRLVMEESIRQSDPQTFAHSQLGISDYKHHSTSSSLPLESQVNGAQIKVRFERDSKERPPPVPSDVGHNQTSSQNKIVAAIGNVTQSSRGLKRAKYFIFILFGTVLVPSLASSILFGRAYISMKKFKTRPYSIIPIEAFDRKTLSKILTEGSPTNVTSQPSPINPKSGSPRKLSSANCDRIKSNQEDCVFEDQADEHHESDVHDNDYQDHPDKFDIDTHLNVPNSGSPYARSSSEPNTPKNLTDTQAVKLMDSVNIRPNEHHGQLVGMNQAEISTSAPFNWLNSQQKGLAREELVALYNNQYHLLNRTPSERYTSNRVVPSEFDPSLHDIAIQRDVSFSAPPTAGVSQPDWDLSEQIFKLRPNLSSKLLMERRSSKKARHGVDRLRNQQPDQQHRIVSPAEARVAEPYRFRRDQSHAQSFHYGSSFRHHYPRLAFNEPQLPPLNQSQALAVHQESHINGHMRPSGCRMRSTSRSPLPRSPEVPYLTSFGDASSSMQLNRRGQRVAELASGPTFSKQNTLTIPDASLVDCHLSRHSSLPRSSRLYQSVDENCGGSSRHSNHPKNQRNPGQQNHMPSDSDAVNMPLGMVIKPTMQSERERQPNSPMANLEEHVEARIWLNRDTNKPHMEESKHDDTLMKQPEARVSKETASSSSSPTSAQSVASQHDLKLDAGPKVATLCAYYYMPDDQLLKSNICVFAFNLTLWLPFILIWLADQYGRYVGQDLRDLVWWIATINCCMCSYVYAFTNKDFREAFSKLFYYFCCKSHVTFARKTPIFRRQLHVDSEGNLRVHLMPSLNLYSNKLSKGGDSHMTNSGHDYGDSMSGQPAPAFGGPCYESRYGNGSGVGRYHPVTSMGLGHLPLAWHHSNFRTHSHEQAEASGAHSTYSGHHDSGSHYHSTASHSRYGNQHQVQSSSQLATGHRQHHMPTVGGFGGLLLANTTRLLRNQQHQANSSASGRNRSALSQPMFGSSRRYCNDDI